MAFQIVGANSRRTKIEIALPITATGEPVLDDDDQLIEGREAVVFVLPRYAFIPRDELRELTKASTEVEKRKIGDDYTAFDRARDSILAQIGPLVGDEVRPLLDTLMLGELQQISDEWSRNSAASLPGIGGLQRFVEEHAEAINYDLIRHGHSLDAIGDTLSWTDVRDIIAHMPPDGTSALFRELHPSNWWWTPEFDMWAAILQAINMGNWQRGQGKGSRPEPLRKPADPAKGVPDTVDELAARKRAHDDELERRRRMISGDN